jgi:serine/threonine protein kinase
MYIGIFSLNKKINILYRILTGTYFGEDDESIGRLLWNDVNFQQKSVFIILRYLLMGIKAIKSVEAGLNLKPDPIFDLQSMIKIRHEPITNYYTFSKKLGSGTYGEVFLAHHDQTGQPRAIKKISVLKFSRAKPMILN